MNKFDLTNARISREVGLIPFVVGSVAAILELDCSNLRELDIGAGDVTFSVIVYPDSRFLTCQYTLWKDTGEEHIRYEPTENEMQLLWEMLEAFSQDHYGCALGEFPAWFQNHALSTCEVKG